MDSFEQFARAGLELAGVEMDEIDLAVMRAADAVYGPELRALDTADLSHVKTEPDLDPGRAPSDR
jgi:hypothetical protein